MENIVLISMATASALFLGIGLFHRTKTKSLGDMLPMVFGKHANILNSQEFNFSVTSSSISLATVLLFFYSAVGSLGPWLFWCAITTMAGIFLVAKLSKQIWGKMNTYDHRPSLHEFLGTEYNSKYVLTAGAVCTVLGYLGVFGLELYIGSLFISALIPSVPFWTIVIGVTAIGFAYSAVGGFRSVIVTDKLMMWLIWSFIIALLSFFFYVLTIGEAANLNSIPTHVSSLQWSNNLVSFLVGILVINSAMFVVSMSIWQRISGSQQRSIAVNGLWRGGLQTGITWSLLIILAILTYSVITPDGSDKNILAQLLEHISLNYGLAGKVIIGITALGVLSSQLSTASTQLISTAHALYEDLYSRYKQSKTPILNRVQSAKELRISQLLLVFAAILSIIVVGGLSSLGFDVVDLAFALYGTQLSLFLPVVLSLLLERKTLHLLSNSATMAVVVGIFLGLTAAVIGKIVGLQDLVFLAPLFSIGSSSIIMTFQLIKIRTIRS